MLQLNDISCRIAGRLLLDHTSAALPTGARVGLVGRNGTGKTTLFKLITGDLGTESGSINLPRNARIGQVAQEAPGGPTSLLDTVLEADTERTELLAEAETATDPTRIADIHTRLLDIDAHSAPSRAATILHGLGFDAEAQDRPCSDFSGGWRMRVALASVLFLSPDLLLLDEPTNYLDLEGALWLQDYLGRYPHTVLTVSHDRDFLDAVTDHTLHLDQGKLTLYRGGYTSFARQREEQRILLEKAADKQSAERKHLQAFVDRFKAKASKARQAQSRMKRLEKMQVITLQAGDESASVVFPSPEKQLSPPIIKLDDVAVGYGSRKVLKKLSLFLSNDDRIGLLGANGNGKSTFVKLLADRLKPMDGKSVRSSKLEVAYFAQHQLDELPLDETPLQLVTRRMPGIPESKIRARTAQLGFSCQKADTPVNKLSGGEKARLLLGLAAFDGPHLLILDEPTNHLDIQMREALIQAIADYQGAVVIVSHDRFLLDATCDQLWLVADGGVKPFDGDMDDYTKYVLAARKQGKDKSAMLTPEPEIEEVVAVPAAPVIINNAARKRIATIEAQLQKLGDLISKVDAALADPKTFQTNPGLAAQLAKDRTMLATRLATAEEEWLEAQATAE
ncbi:MAG: ABC-F family ATP-binding cassette domain-containing protein [Beijerinckiaceae bacterium]